MQSDLKALQGGPYLISIGSYILFSFLLVLGIISIVVIALFIFKSLPALRYVLYFT